MVRSAAAILAVLILPEIALAHQAQGDHTVVNGDTLWDLAQQYYGDPFDWRRIWTANQANIADPNLIMPGQVLVIPGTAPSGGTEVVEASGPAEPTSLRDIPTIFRQDTTLVRGGVVRASELVYQSVPRDVVFSAPRLTGMDGDPPHTGMLEGSAGGSNRGPTVRSFERVRVSMAGPARVGEQLQIFAVDGLIEDVGRVVSPTGVMTVSRVVSGGVIGTIAKEYGRILPGHFVGPMPVHDVSVGQYAQPVSGGAVAMVMGFAKSVQIANVGQVAFLDLGMDDGLALGDEFSLYNTSDPNVLEGVLQVVGLSEQTAAARIVRMRDAVFDQGVVVRLTKKMR